MNSAKKAALGGTAALLLAVGIEIAWLHYDRNRPMATAPAATQKVDDDDLVFLKKERPSSMADIKQLVGKKLWVSAGGQMDYYPYSGHRVGYEHSAGTCWVRNRW